MKSLKHLTVLGAILVAVVCFSAALLREHGKVPAETAKNVGPVVKKIAEKSIQPACPAPVFRTEELTVKSGETFISLLKKLGLPSEQAYQVAMQAGKICSVKKIIPGQHLSLIWKNEQPLRLEYQINEATSLTGTWDREAKFSAVTRILPYETKAAVVRGSIDSSLYAGIIAAGEKAALADLLASLFEFDIDFNRDIHSGDTFSLIVEKKFLDGRFADYGRILAAEVNNRDRSIRVVLFGAENASPAYYHPDGRSVKKMFLRCPLPFMRVTSSYGRRRHPVLGFSARHNGVDLGAPTGTRIKATASGVVDRAGYTRSRGRFLILRHPNHYFTHYYHLSGIRRGIRRGTRVTQGQIIGYVGSTGLSTGPHLHYGVRKNNRFINPMRLRSPSRKPLPARYVPRLAAVSEAYFFSMAADRWLSGIELPGSGLKGLLERVFSGHPETPGTVAESVDATGIRSMGASQP